MGTSSDGDRPLRWALIFTGQFRYPAIRLVEERRIPAWETYGWTVLVRDTDVIFNDLEDVRREDERGRR